MFLNMVAGFADRLMSMEEVAELIDVVAPDPGRPAINKKLTKLISN